MPDEEPKMIDTPDLEVAEYLEDDDNEQADSEHIEMDQTEQIEPPELPHDDTQAKFHAAPIEADQAPVEQFSFAKCLAGVTQAIAAMCLIGVLYIGLSSGNPLSGIMWALVAVALQIMALTLYTMRGE